MAEMTVFDAPCKSVLLPLTKGQFAIIDEADLPLVSAWKWTAQACGPGRFYARRNVRIDGRCTKVYLHRFLVGAGPGEQVDHANQNGLDCRRSNLRRCTKSQNMANVDRRTNATGFTGVYRSRRPGLWLAVVKKDGRWHRAGDRFQSPEEAARARDVLAKQLHGEFFRPTLTINHGDHP